jgi:hypothetical protein
VKEKPSPTRNRFRCRRHPKKKGDLFTKQNIPHPIGEEGSQRIYFSLITLKKDFYSLRKKPEEKEKQELFKQCKRYIPQFFYF